MLFEDRTDAVVASLQRGVFRRLLRLVGRHRRAWASLARASRLADQSGETVIAVEASARRENGYRDYDATLVLDDPLAGRAVAGRGVREEFRVGEGALGSGTLKGEVMNESKKRTFTFEGSGTQGALVFAWEETVLRIPITRR